MKEGRRKEGHKERSTEWRMKREEEGRGGKGRRGAHMHKQPLTVHSS